jgi:hypothetical protein
MVTELSEVDDMDGYEEICAKMAELPTWQQYLVIRYVDFLIFKQEIYKKNKNKPRINNFFKRK